MKPLPFVINPNPDRERMETNKDKKAVDRKRALDLFERRELIQEYRNLGVDIEEIFLRE